MSIIEPGFVHNEAGRHCRHCSLQRKTPGHFAEEYPRVGTHAPDVQFLNLRSGKTLHVAELLGAKPVLLIFGSCTCGIFRDLADSIKGFAERNKGRVATYIVYTLEAHPVYDRSPNARCEWHTVRNEAEDMLWRQSRTMSAREDDARKCEKDVDLKGVPVLVDPVERGWDPNDDRYYEKQSSDDNPAWMLYGKRPVMSYLIGGDGIIAAKQRGFRVYGMQRAVEDLLEKRCLF